VHRVKFSTEQVTKEMQGVWVEGMLVWSIMRNEDGPFKAFRNLGEDLTTGDPKTANDSLTSMANAIVRSAIANSTLSQMLREREELRV
jgi:regulator of protease activity HflC (stomatin/prohibitin superfamily)